MNETLIVYRGYKKQKVASLQWFGLPQVTTLNKYGTTKVAELIKKSFLASEDIVSVVVEKLYILFFVFFYVSNTEEDWLSYLAYKISSTTNLAWS